MPTTLPPIQRARLGPEMLIRGFLRHRSEKRRLRQIDTHTRKTKLIPASACLSSHTLFLDAIKNSS